MSPSGHDEMNDPPVENSHGEVKRALVEYCQFPHRQGFAVMVDGRWGSGKTHFIMECKDSLAVQRLVEDPPSGVWRRRQKRRTLPCIYVSLYGVKTSSEIDDLLFEKIHPFFANRATKLAGVMLRGLSKIAIKVDLGHAAQLSGVVPEADITSMLSSASNRTIIFDDFERALMEPAAILGYLNPLVEHDNCKVIVVADESQIKEREDYRVRKEKTIGRTYHLKPSADEIYRSLLERIDNTEVRDFLNFSRNRVVDTFTDSGLNNIRILKQFLWDFEIFWPVFTMEHKKNKKAIQEIVSLLCASALELRSGRIQEADFRLLDFFQIAMAQRQTSQDSSIDPMDTVRQRYPSVSFDSTAPLSAETICDCVLRARVSIPEVRKQLKVHRLFAGPLEEDTPSWRALWQSFEMDEGQQHSVIKSFEKDFEDRLFTNRGVIYHVFGLCLWLSKLGYQNWQLSP